MNEIDCASLQGVLTRIASELCLIRETMQINRRDAMEASRVPAVTLDPMSGAADMEQIAELIKKMNEGV